MKTILTVLTVIFLASIPVMAEDDVFKCAGQYDHNDDTCYMKDGEFEHFNYADGPRYILNEDEKYFGYYYWWLGGLPYGYYPVYYPSYRYPRYRGGGRRFRGYGRGRRFRR
jgi:hypothetical protein